MIISDRDECKKYGKKICHNGYCVNTPGKYHCDCKKGYRFHRPSKQCVGKISSLPKLSFMSIYLSYITWCLVVDQRPASLIFSKISTKHQTLLASSKISTTKYINFKFASIIYVFVFNITSIIPIGYITRPKRLIKEH